MSRRFIAVFVAVALLLILISFWAKSAARERGERLIKKVDSQNEKSLLALSESYKAKKDYLKARSALKELVRRFPDSKEASDARKEIESLNVAVLFSDSPTEDSFIYKIQPGDTLVKVALKYNTTVELLKKSNNLKSDLILPGKAVKVSKAVFSIYVDKTDNILTLRKENGETVKTYVVSTGENFCTPEGDFKIEEKLVSPLWYKVGAVVDPGSPEYELGSRWMGLSVSGYGIHGTNDDSTIGRHITKGCVRMKNKDVDELYAIVPSGTKVTIVE